MALELLIREERKGADNSLCIGESYTTSRYPSLF